MKTLVPYKLNGDGLGGTDLHISRPTPVGDDPWGMLAPLRGTGWEPYIYIVSGEAFSHALHGYLQPLLDELGPPPLKVAKRIPDDESICELIDSCVVADRARCFAAGPPPDCYAPPVEDPLLSRAMQQVSLAWADGSYVVVVVGSEFSLS